MINTNFEARKTFLKELPRLQIKKIVIKIVLFLLFNTVISAILAVLISFPLKDSPLFNERASGFIREFTYYVLSFIFLSFVFYKGKINKVFLQTFQTKNINNNIKPLLFATSSIFMLTLSLNYVSLRFSNIREKQLWLDSYINSWKAWDYSVNDLAWVVTSILVYFTFAFFEEFTFRFTVYRFLRKNGFLLSLVISSFLFALMHGRVGFLNHIIFAIIITIYYEYTNNFWGGVIIHTINNQVMIHLGYYFTYVFLKM